MIFTLTVNVTKHMGVDICFSISAAEKVVLGGSAGHVRMTNTEEKI